MEAKEWEECQDVCRLVSYVLWQDSGERRYRLAAAALYHCLRYLPDHSFKRIREFAENLADHPSLDLPMLNSKTSELVCQSQKFLEEYGEAAACLIRPADLALQQTVSVFAGLYSSQAVACAAIRDIFGYPCQRACICGHVAECSNLQIQFAATRNCTRCQELRNDHAVAVIAEDIYHTRKFHELPILADALHDAGCENENFLAHFRTPARHYLGCIHLDLVRGKVHC